MIRKKKLLLGMGILFGMLTLLGVGLIVRHAISEHHRFYGEPRKQWKNLAIATVSRKVADSAWLTNEIATLKSRTAVAEAEPATLSGKKRGWVSDNLLLMRNGEWIVFTNICSKQDNRIHDLFIGHGSDGKWYYSTYHFCIGLVTLDVWDIHQPQNIPRFALTCFLQEFDGRSDDCLKRTWGPEEYRASKAKWGGVQPP